MKITICFDRQLDGFRFQSAQKDDYAMDNECKDTRWVR